MKKQKQHKFKPGQRVEVIARNSELESRCINLRSGQTIFIDSCEGHWDEPKSKKTHGAPCYGINGSEVPETYLRKPKDLKPV